MERKAAWPARFNAILAGLNLTAFIFYAGMTWSKIGVLEGAQDKTMVRVDRIEQTGSLGMQTYAMKNDERTEAIKARLSAVELATAALPVIQGDLRVIQGKLDGLREQLQRHEVETKK